MTLIAAGSVFQNSGALFLARVRSSSGSYVTQATLSTITCRVSNMTTGVAVTVISPTITISTSVFDALQTDAYWTQDTTGYNFKHAMPATAFPTANNVYRVEYKFTPTSGAVFYVEFQVTALETLT